MNRYTDLWRKLERVSANTYLFEETTSQHQLIFGIGWVAHEFEGIQETVLRLFSVLCGAEKSGWNFQLSGVLAISASFSMKVKFCKEAAEQFRIDSSRREALYRWLALAERASDRRNDIVHGRLIIHQNDGGPRQAIITPPTFDRRRGGLFTLSAREPAYSYNPEQVQEYADAIGRVNGNLLTVMMMLAGGHVEAGDEWMLDPAQLTK